MPMKPKHPCAVRTCPNLTNDRYCDAHKREGWKQLARDYPRPSAVDRGYDADWQKVRNAYIKTHPVCEVCGRAKTAIVHHIVSVRQDPSRRLDASNLQGVCKSCHEKRHGWDGPAR